MREPNRVPFPLRAAKVVRRLALPVVLLGGLLLWRNYGMFTVPEGMDTLPDSHPPGTRCLVEKRPSRVRPGSVVFVEARGGILLSRVDAVLPGDRILLAHENPRSRFADLQDQPFPLSAVRALVLVAFVPTPEVPSRAR
ncbi:MAG TPA: hypothetical protein VK081_02385 [Planctomycetota bacterium]|nr:hypothetical protein [Planctomycetota bacterium]